MSSKVLEVRGIEIVVPLRITMQTAMTSRRREDFFKREDFKREFLNLGFVSRLQGVNCEPLKLGARYDVYKPFFKKVPPEEILPSS